MGVARKTATKPARSRRARLKGVVSRHYYAYMPAKKHHRALVWVFFLMTVGVMAFQLLYSLDRVLPFARVDGRFVGGTERNVLAGELQKQFESAMVTMTSGTHAETRRVTELGAEVNTESMVDTLSEYPFWQRLVPFSILMKWPQTTYFTTEFSGVELAKHSDTLAAKLSYDPVDASVTLKNGELVIGSAAPGRKVTANDVRGDLTNARYGAGKTTITVRSRELFPKSTDADIATATNAASAALGRAVQLVVAGKQTFTPNRSTKAGWLVVASDGAHPELRVNRELIRQYVADADMKVRTVPGVTTVRLVDGVEQARSEGATGTTLAIDDVTDALAKAILGQDSPIVQAAPQPVAPSIQFNRTYSNSQAGLQAYVDYATSTQNVRIVLQQLSGNGWTAMGRQDESIPSASTYKLYVMLRVFDDISSGALTWDAPMLDTTAGGCFERTIVPSTNPCAEEWIRRYGKTALTEYIHDKGFSKGTGFTFSDATHTTAGDLAKYLRGLYDGTLISGNNRDTLLEKMGRQLYRGGIPSGTKGRVQDKVGFLWDYIHDAAIVHHPKGDYILVLMTKGYGTYNYMANITRQIEAIMYP